MFVAVDDTDSMKGNCTTFLATEIIREFGDLDLIGNPRLVRLNPATPWKTRGNSTASRSSWSGRSKNCPCPKSWARGPNMHLPLRRAGVVAAVRKGVAAKVGDVTANAAEAAGGTDALNRQLRRRRSKGIRQQRWKLPCLRLHHPLRRVERPSLPRAVPAVQNGVGIAADAGTVGAENRRTEQPQRLRPNRLHRPRTANNRRGPVALGQRKRDPESSGKPVGSGLLFEGGSDRSPR